MSQILMHMGQTDLGVNFEFSKNRALKNMPQMGQICKKKKSTKKRAAARTALLDLKFGNS
jgi:hypothetical protein